MIGLVDCFVDTFALRGTIVFDKRKKINYWLWQGGQRSSIQKRCAVIMDGLEKKNARDMQFFSEVMMRLFSWMSSVLMAKS